MSELEINAEVVQWTLAGKAVNAATAYEALAADKPLLVLMHGLGSHEGDLIGLAPFLPQEFVCASLRAPLAAYDPHDGYSWFELSLQPGGVTPEQAGQQARSAAEAVIEWLDKLEAKVFAGTFARLENIAIMGFSQGGVMVTSLLRLQPARFFAGVNCSGFIAQTEFEKDYQLEILQPPFFWGRDDEDPIISRRAVAATADWAPKHTTLTERTYPGIAHSISRTELKDISEFLLSVLKI